MTLTGTRPHVKAAGQILGQYFRFSDSEMGGVRPDPIPDHPSGVAIDFMGGSNMSRDVNLFTAVQTRPAVWNYLNIQYVIWQQTYYDAPGKAGSKMEDRGSPTANHMDHVHITFKQMGAIPTYDGFLTAIGGAASIPQAGVLTPGVAETAGAGIADALSGIGDVLNVLKKLVDVFAFMSDPKNWWRIGLFFLGVVALGIGLVRLDSSGTAASVASKATKAVTG